MAGYESVQLLTNPFNKCSRPFSRPLPYFKYRSPTYPGSRIPALLLTFGRHCKVKVNDLRLTIVKLLDFITAVPAPTPSPDSAVPAPTPSPDSAVPAPTPSPDSADLTSRSEANRGRFLRYGAKRTDTERQWVSLCRLTSGCFPVSSRLPL